jgi:type I restriction enzyme R subunit
MKFTEEKLEQGFIKLIGNQKIPYVSGKTIIRNPAEVLLKDDLRKFLLKQYKASNLTNSEVEQIIRKLETYSAFDLYESNKSIMKLLSDGFVFKREDPKAKDLWIYLIDYPTKQNHVEAALSEKLDIAAESNNEYLINPDNNIYKIVNQLEIEGYEKRIPDGILYINGLPVVVFEFKSAIRENATIYDAYIQLTVRYQRDIPELFKYNVFCVISDGVNNKAGSFFAPYDFYYAWRKITGNETEVDGIDSMYSMIEGMFNHDRLRDIIRNFIYIPDASKKDEKIVCRYPQFYAASKLYQSIKIHQRPQGDGKGGTYFGATDCGKSYTMLFLSRLLMKSVEFSSPTIVLITDRTDLDDQLSKTFTNAKGFIGDNTIVSVESRAQLRELLQSKVLEDFTDKIIDLYHELKKEKESFGDMGINFEEKAFFDILMMIAHKFDFDYPKDKCINLSKEVKKVVDDKAKYIDWNHRDDIKAELKMDLIKLLAKFGYPPITKDEVYKEILEQAENFKKFNNG